MIDDRESMQNLIDNRSQLTDSDPTYNIIVIIVILVKAVTIVLEMTFPGDGSSENFETYGELAVNIESKL